MNPSIRETSIPIRNAIALFLISMELIARIKTHKVTINKTKEIQSFIKIPSYPPFMSNNTNRQAGVIQATIVPSQQNIIAIRQNPTLSNIYR